MSLLLLAPNRDMHSWKQALLKEDGNLDVEIWPDVSSPERVQFIICWDQPSNLLNAYPNLKAISSLGAGVDHILSDSSLPQQVTVSRIVSASLSQQMQEYVLNAVLNYQRNTLEYILQKQRVKWNPQLYKSPADCPIGVMGLGALGLPVAKSLAELGYQVIGWSRSAKSVKGIQTFAGSDEFNAFLSQTRILVCLLPLTDETHGILDLDTFKSLRHPAYVINVARGEHLVEEDLIYALDTEWLEGACLDVFTEEPLPERHPFWNRRNIMITPHVSSITLPEEVAGQIVENYKRALSGMELINEVDRELGY